MVDHQTLHRSLASSGAVLVTFIGVCHAFVGAPVFPWAPSTFGSPLAFHSAGVALIVAGLALLGGTLRVVALPVIWLALVLAFGGALITAYTAVVHGEFHLFALALSLASVLIAFSHRRAESLAAVPAPDP